MEKKLALFVYFLGALFIVDNAFPVEWTSNLLQNPGAETGSLAPWITDDSSLVNTVQSRPEASGTVFPYAGQWFFNMAKAEAAPSGVTAIRRLYQDLDITTRAYETDAQLLVVEATMHIQTEDVPHFEGRDYGQMTLYFLDQQQSNLDEVSTGLVTSPNLTWVQETLESAIMPGTRTIRLELIGEKHETEYINAFFDDITLRIGVIPEPATLCLLGYGFWLWRTAARMRSRNNPINNRT